MGVVEALKNFQSVEVVLSLKFNKTSNSGGIDRKK
jgi:hypothetical protein